MQHHLNIVATAVATRLFRIILTPCRRAAAGVGLREQQHGGASVWVQLVRQALLHAPNVGAGAALWCVGIRRQRPAACEGVCFLLQHRKMHKYFKVMLAHSLNLVIDNRAFHEVARL